MQSNVDRNFFPGWTRKSITFTIDDGNIEHDTHFLSIVRPAGIKGTFNLHRVDYLTPDEYREMYSGYEIANHCRNHPLVFREGVEYKISDEPFDRATSPTDVLYRTDNPDIYLMHIYFHGNTNPAYAPPRGWHTITDPESYKRFAKESHDELEAIFGEGTVRGFAWPHGKQNNAEVKNWLMSELKYTNVRKTGDIRDTTGFSFPSDLSDWTYNAHNTTLLEVMKLYEDYPDDGELKFFSFGVHSKDFEASGNWCDLEKFAELYGNRKNDYYYATVSELFDYAEAVKALTVTDTEIVNKSEIALYLKINGSPVIIAPHATYALL